MHDHYSLKSRDIRALKKELKRIKRISKGSHIRCEQCVTNKCKDPYRELIQVLSAEIKLKEPGQYPIKFLAYVARIVGKLLALWK